MRIRNNKSERKKDHEIFLEDLKKGLPTPCDKDEIRQKMRERFNYSTEALVLGYLDGP